MGSPATPTAADRAEVRRLAAAVVRSVEEDADVTSFVQRETGLMIEDVLVEVCQEVLAQQAELTDSQRFNAELAKDVGELESGRMWHEAATERERIRTLLERACKIARRLASLECDSDSENEIDEIARSGGALL